MNEEKEEKRAAQTGKEEYKSPRFFELVLSVGAGALQALNLGVPDKEGNRNEINLELARFSIDMLELLQKKTEGNLAEDEEKFLREILHQLRKRYVEVATKPKKEAT